MKRVQQIARELEQIETIHSLTGVFENIASMRIGRIKDQVLASSNFFTELWQLYTSLSVRAQTPGLQALAAQHHIDRTAFVLITSEGGLSGDIDQQVLNAMGKEYKPEQVDLLVIGNHGVTLLEQQGIKPAKFFRLPTSDAPVDTGPVIKQIKPYRQAYIFYQKFISLAIQRVERIELMSAVKALSERPHDGRAVISPDEFIFEPGVDQVVTYLETVMMGIALNQTIMESRLSQLASRFNAMSLAKERADDLAGDLKRDFFGAKRALSDQRIREVITAMEAL
jgi:F-type H+-transporting ATPase subunit gamma